MSFHAAVCVTGVVTFVILQGNCMSSNATDFPCNSMPVYFQRAKLYYFVAFYPQEANNFTATHWTEHFSHKPGLIGYVEFYVCDHVETTIRACLYLLLNQKFIQKDGTTSVLAIDSHLSTAATEIIANLFSPFQVQINAYEEMDINPKIYPQFVSTVMDTFSSKIMQIVKQFRLHNLVLIVFQRNENDSLYRDEWKQFEQTNFHLCVKRYNIKVTDTNRMQNVIKDLARDSDKKVIVCYSPAIRRSPFVSNGLHHVLFENAFQRLINISFHYNLTGKTWIWNNHSPAIFTSLHNGKIDAVDGSLVISSGSILELGDITSAVLLSRASFKQLRLFAAVYNYFLFSTKFPKTLFLKFLKENTPVNCFYTSSPTYSPFESKVNDRLWRTCKSFPSQDIPSVIQWGNNSTEPPLSICEMKDCPPGFEPTFTTVYDDNYGGSREWSCRFCDENKVKPMNGTSFCFICQDFTVPNIAKTHCYDPYKKMYIFLLSKTGIVITVNSAIGVGSVMFFILTHVRHKNTPVVRSSNYYLTLCQLLAHLFLFLLNPFSFIGEPYLIQCQLRHVLVGILFTSITSVTFLKVQKLLFLFKQKVQLSKKLKRMANFKDLFSVILFMLADIILSVCTWLKRPAMVASARDTKLLIVTVSCNTLSHLNLQLILCGVLLFFVFIQGLRAWKLPSYFNETKYIVFANLTSILILLCMYPLYFSATDDVLRSNVQAISILLSNAILMFILHGYKAYIIYFKPNDNTLSSFRAKMQQHSEERVKTKIRNLSARSSKTLY